MRRYNLISAPFSCGVSWVVSVLIELGIRATHEAPRRYPDGFWRALPGGDGAEEIVPEGVSHMRYYLPALHRGNSFRLQEGLEVFWEHRLDFVRHSDRPVILFLRDPRDAIRSLHQRNYAHFGWLEYLRRPDQWRDHFPEMFNLPPPETWAAWHAMWLGLGSLTPVKCLRFEDSRENPLAMVRDILGFLGVERSEEAIQRAIQNSTFERTKEAMEKTEAVTGAKFGVARRGKVGEWKEVYDEEALRLFGGPTADWMRRLGYEPAPASLSGGISWELRGEADVPEFARRRLAEFRRCWESGDLPAAREQLRQAQIGAQSPDQSEQTRLWVAATLVALNWTTSVLGELLLRSTVARAVFASFSQFNHRYGEWPSVRNMLLEAVPQGPAVRSDAFGSLDGPRFPAPVAAPKPAPATDEKPLLVEDDYRGYRLLGFRGRFYAVALRAEGLDLAALTSEALTQQRRIGSVFVGDLGFEVKEQVDRFVKKP